MDDADFELRNLVGLLRRQLRLILIVLVVAVGLAALVVFSLTPRYSASVLLLVDTSQKNLLDPDYQGGNAEIDNARVDSEVEILQSTSILMTVIKEMSLVRDPELGVKLGLVDRVMAFLQVARPTLPSGDAALGRVLNTLRGAIEVDRRSRTNLIDITVTTEDPKRAADIANVWAAAYIQDQVAAKVNSSLMSRDALQARMKQAREAIVTSEGAFDAFINSSLSQIVTETGRTDIAGMRDRLADLTSTRAADSNRAELAQASLNQRNWTTLAKTLQSEALNELDRQQRELNTRIQTASIDQTVDLRAELAKVEQRLIDAAAGELNSLRQSVYEAQSQEGEVRQQLRTAVLSSSLSPDILAKIYELQQGSELARAQYQTLLTRIQDMESQASLQVADSRVVSAALTPSRPSFPNINLTLALAGLAGLGLGVVLAFLRENILGGILTEEQASAVLRVPIAAALPREKGASRDGASAGGLADLMVTAAMSSFPEGVRRIKVAIDQATHRKALKTGVAPGNGKAVVIMVTSSTANEGKSTVALSLARAFALARRSVVIIDCDLRKPTIHKMLGLNPSTSLIDYLKDDQAALDLSAITEKDVASEARVIVGARPSDVPTDQLITGRAFARMLSKVRETYDIVILDTPPVGPVVDGLYLAQAVDFILFILRSGTTSQTEAKMALASLKGAKAPDTELQAVLNQQERASASYKGKYESYYYSDTT